MSGPQTMLHNGLNVLREITPVPQSAPGVRAAVGTVTPLRPTTARTGRGRVRLTGAYTGLADTLIDVEIQTGGATSRAGAPVYRGAGNGDLRDISVTGGATAQTITFTLINLGTDDRGASAEFYGVALRSKQTGVPGNSIRVVVDPLNPSGILGPLTRASGARSALVALSEGEERMEGSGFDFGGLPLLPGRVLDPATPRIGFAGFAPVYRQYMAVENGIPVYYLDKPLAFGVPAGTVVETVSGAVEVQVTDGSTVETYSDTITLYDLLRRLLGSQLVGVDGVVIEDLTPGGMATDEFPLRTAAYSDQITGAGSDYASEITLNNVAVQSAAGTELIELGCIENETVGAEVWTVKGALSGVLSNATTSRLYNDAGSPIAFSIPKQLPADGKPVDGIWDLKTQFLAREQGQGIPKICLDRPRLGGKAVAKTLTLVWTERPPAECTCEDAVVLGQPSSQCLGIDLEGEDVANRPAWAQAALQRLTDWHRDFARSNTEITANGELRTAVFDLQLAATAYEIVRSAIEQLTTNPDALLDYPTWTASTAIEKYEHREPSVRNDYLYEAETAGTTAASEPTWPVVEGGTVVDGGVTWRFVGKIPTERLNALQSQIETDATALEALGAEYDLITGTEPPLVAATTAYTAKTSFVRNGTWEYGVCLVSGTTNATVSGTESLVRGVIVSIGGVLFLGLGALRTGSDDDIDNTAARADEQGISRAVSEFVARWRGEAGQVLAYANIDPKFEAGLAGGECWQDNGDSHYWEIEGTAYLPVFNGVYYHSAVRRFDPDTGREIIESTQEFGFGLKVGCMERLLVGDKIIVKIDEIEHKKTYVIGDKIEIKIVAGAPLYLKGGITGDNTYTFSAAGSADGALPDYPVIDGAETPYSQAGLTVTFYRGGIPNALGDQIALEIEQGQYRWRQDGGAYVVLADIPDAPVALVDGLSIAFDGGATPSWADGDLYQFRAKQPHAPNHVNVPKRTWRWDSAAPVLRWDLGVDTDIDAVAIPVHSLQQGAAVVFRGRDAGLVDLWSQAVTWRAGVMFYWFDSPQACRYLDVELSGADDSALAWVWAGDPLVTEYAADDADISPSYRMLGQTAGAQRYIDRGAVGEFSWTNGLTKPDVDNIVALLDHVKQSGNEPIVAMLAPEPEHADTWAVVRIEADAVRVPEWHAHVDFNRAQPGNSWLASMSLPFAPYFHQG